MLYWTLSITRIFRRIEIYLNILILHLVEPRPQTRIIIIASLYTKACFGRCRQHKNSRKKTELKNLAIFMIFLLPKLLFFYKIEHNFKKTQIFYQNSRNNIFFGKSTILHSCISKQACLT